MLIVKQLGVKLFTQHLKYLQESYVGNYEVTENCHLKYLQESYAGNYDVTENCHLKYLEESYAGNYEVTENCKFRILNKDVYFRVVSCVFSFSFG